MDGLRFLGAFSFVLVGIWAEACPIWPGALWSRATRPNLKDMNDFCEVGGRRIRAAGVAVGGFYFFFLATFSSWLSYGKVVEEVMAQETALSARLRELSGKAPLETCRG